MSTSNFCAPDALGPHPEPHRLLAAIALQPDVGNKLTDQLRWASWVGGGEHWNAPGLCPLEQGAVSTTPSCLLNLVSLLTVLFCKALVAI